MILIILIMNIFYISLTSSAILDPILAIFDDECVTVPMECPNINITFWLYTKDTQDKPHKLVIEDPETIYSAPWIENSNGAIILLHGYTGDKDFSPNTELRPAYFKYGNFNIISVDYGPIAKEPCYIAAAQNIRVVAKCTAELIEELVLYYGFVLPEFHIIGFSLGGQGAGFIGKYIQSGRLKKKLYRITALDPALPLFLPFFTKEKVYKTDAVIVYILHTCGGREGKLEASGKADFYANGGISQPGCKLSGNENDRSFTSCSHYRAVEYYAESINTKVGFYAKKILSSIKILFGEHGPKNASGIYTFETNSKPPYAKGPGK